MRWSSVLIVAVIEWIKWSLGESFRLNVGSQNNNSRWVNLNFYLCVWRQHSIINIFVQILKIEVWLHFKLVIKEVYSPRHDSQSAIAIPALSKSLRHHLGFHPCDDSRTQLRKSNKFDRSELLVSTISRFPCAYKFFCPEFLRRNEMLQNESKICREQT